MVCSGMILMRDDEDMIQLVESIKERGVITPATVRQKEDGRYELISGHRRKRACELAGFEALRCEVVDLDRDAATVLMVESNYQRSQILPSEKAFAYKMRLEALSMLDLPVPKAVFHNISVKPSEIQKQMVAELAERAEKVRNGMVDAKVDNMLKITNDGRKLALDQRLINPLLPDFEDSKLNVCVDAMFETWERGSEKRLTQLFFCDLSTPKNDGSFNVYDDIRQKLIARGVPADEIKFIHEADTEAKKLELFKKVRRGDVRILMGSTQKMGAGTNVQNKLAASSDLDCPWRPSDLEQRLGRSIRQGNENAEVHIYRFVTEETFDAYLYQLVEGKQELDNLEKQFETAKIDVERPFPQEEELKTKTARLNELNALLNVDKRENEIVGGEPDEGEEPPEKKPRDLER